MIHQVENIMKFYIQVNSIHVIYTVRVDYEEYEGGSQVAVNQEIYG